MKKRKKEIFPFMPFKLQTWLQTRLHTAMASHKVKGSTLGYAPSILPPPLTSIIHNFPCLSDFINLFIKHCRHGGHASYHEMSYSKKVAKLKKFSPLCPLSCWVGHRRDFHPRASYSFGNPKLWYIIRFPSPELSHAFPLTNPSIHSYHAPNILLGCQTFKPLFLKQSFKVSIHLFRGLPTEQLPAQSPTNPIILYFVHMDEPPFLAY